MLCPCERLEQQQGKMQSDKMCPVTLGIHKTKTSLLAGTLGSLQHQQASSKGCRGEAHAKHSNSSRIRAHATQNAVRQNAFRYLRLIHIKQKQVSWPAPLAAANTSRLPRSAMEEPMRNTRTAAGFEPMPSKMQSNKMLPVTFGIHWNP